MTDKQTQCPNCASIYKVSVTQLTVAQGMVCCPKCACSFNALLHLKSIKNNNSQEQQHTEILSLEQETINSSSDLLKIFNLKVEHSNINLETYLNNLTYFNTEPHQKTPILNLAEDKAFLKQQTVRITYYIIWGVVTSILIIILCLQLFVFNHNFSQHPSINNIMIKFCNFVKCSNLDKQYTLILLGNIKIHTNNHENFTLIGELTNKNQQSLQMPLLLLTLSKDGKTIFSQTYTPKEYLTHSLKNIQRIPIESPFTFDLFIPVPAKSFDHYKLQIIRP
ncbi:hypothetical protein B9T31_12400 [Acinetobacter sp. ANC 4558]|uniref:DUF3426 domain-containing protein n=1 Tax=Acinetobacter sp. ANC 4558 TaxID=1977876 RepID=UPI000A3342B7|nr:DUF3426 domain-containing protein [Acinetobacter sp. ANC 4558]OTG85272.1 hypothetical protein B9T31_12400 [Acinetobacter sp. ANC 4558]